MKKLILLFLITISVSVSAQIDKVEPPFWYENMTNNQVQIMFYGKNIAQNTVTVSNGVVITQVQKTENPNNNVSSAILLILVSNLLVNISFFILFNLYSISYHFLTFSFPFLNSVTMNLLCKLVKNLL